MGRISLPFLNKAGTSLFWGSVWDNKHNYTKNLKEDIFLKTCVPFIFKNRISSKLIFFLKKKALVNSDIIQSDILNFSEVNYKNLHSYYNYRSKKIDMYLGKTWVLKYQNWVILYIFFYSALFNERLKIPKRYGRYIFEYNDIFYNYYSGLIKINFNFEEFKQKSKKSFYF